MASSTSPGATPVVPVSAALALSTGAGLLAGVQMRVTGVLGQKLGSVVFAATLSFVLGLLALLAAATARPSTRAAMRRLVRSDIPRWMFGIGVTGAANVTTFTLAVPRIGIALYAVAAVSGQTLGGFVVDRLGVGVGGRRPVNRPRIIGASIAIVAVAVTQLGRPAGQIAFGLIALAVAVNGFMALMIAVNGRLNQAAGDPLAAATVHVLGATTVLSIAAVLLGLTGHVHIASWPTAPWLYCGGLANVILIVFVAISARTLDVLRVALTINGGQLAAGLVIDGLLPGGTGVSAGLLAGCVLTLVAVAVAGRQPVPQQRSADTRARRILAAPGRPVVTRRAGETVPTSTERSQ